MNKLDFGAICKYAIDKTLIYNALNGVVQISRAWQRGPFCKPSPAAAVLYSPPITPTAANAMDKNIWGDKVIRQGWEHKCRLVTPSSGYYWTVV